MSEIYEKWLWKWLQQNGGKKKVASPLDSLKSLGDIVGESWGWGQPSYPLCYGQHTCYNGWDKGLRSHECELTLKTHS